MTQQRLSNDEFFTRLADLLASKKDHGTVTLTQKRLSYDSSNPPPTTPSKPSRVTKSTSKTPVKQIHKPTRAPSPPLPSLAAPSSLPPSSGETSSTEVLSESTSQALPSQSYPVLIRATNSKSNDKRHDGKHIKLATVVEEDALEGFFAKYAETCKVGFTTLKKRDRKKAKQASKKKKRKEVVTATTTVTTT